MVARSKKSRPASGVRKARGTAAPSQAVGRVRQALESAQGRVQSRIGTARDQATETWENLEALIQNRIQKALHQIGVPTSGEIRLLTRRVEELHDSVKALSARPARRGGWPTGRSRQG